MVFYLKLDFYNLRMSEILLLMFKRKKKNSPVGESSAQYKPASLASSAAKHTNTT